MGASESKRRVVIEEGDEVNVTVSEAVVRRLKGQQEVPTPSRSAPASSKADKAPIFSSPPPPPLMSEEQDQLSPLMRKDAEDFYLQKLKELQQRNTALLQDTNQQFAIAVKEVEGKFVKATGSPICQDLQAKVLECYRSNPSQLLDCSAMAQAFSTCVNRARIASSAKRMQGIS